MVSYFLVGPQHACTRYITGIIARHPDVQEVLHKSVPSASNFLSFKDFLPRDKIIIVTRDVSCINHSNYVDYNISLDDNLADQAYIHIKNEINSIVINGYPKKNIIYVSIESIILYKELYIKYILKKLELNIDNYDFKLEGRFTPLDNGKPTWFTVNLPIENPNKKYISKTIKKTIDKGSYLLIGPQHSCTRYITGIISKHQDVREIHHFSVPCGNKNYPVIEHINRGKIIIVARDTSCINKSNYHSYNIDIKENIANKASRHIKNEINFLISNGYDKKNIIYVSIESINLYKELYIKYLIKKLGLDLTKYDLKLEGRFTPLNNSKPTWFTVNLPIENPNKKYISKIL